MKIKNIDKFGHCVVCHKNLIKNVAINGKIEGVFDADKDDAMLKLNNGSLLPISICRPCKESVNLDDPKVHKQIMEAVQEGWRLEIDHMDKHPDKFPEWTPNKREHLKKFYSGLHITHHHKGGA